MGDHYRLPALQHAPDASVTPDRAPRALAQLSFHHDLPPASRLRGRSQCSATPATSACRNAARPGAPPVDQIVRPERNGHLATLRGQEWQVAPVPVRAPE